MISLLADIRVLSINSKHSYLNDNYASGVSTLQLANPSGFAVDSFILVGDEGKESTELFRIGTVDSATGDITLLTSAGGGTTTRFPHAESTKVTVIPYNQIRFFWTAATGTIADETPVFSSAIPLTSYTEISPSDLYTTYDDNVNSTGFGWFQYRNSVTGLYSQVSNSIPYSGYSLNSVSNIFADIDSLLNVKEKNLLTLQDKFSFLNEALALIRNKLNLTSTWYFVSTQQTLAITPGTAEYLLPSDFTDIVEITDGLNTSSSSGYAIPFMSTAKALEYNGNGVFYYLRGRYIGFCPTPSTSATYYYRYRAKATRLTSLSDLIDLPDDAYYCLKDFVMYRAKSKFTDPQAAMFYLKAFNDNMDLYIQSAVKRDNDLPSWEHGAYSNI